MADRIDIDKVRVGTPCHESWDAMTDEGDRRFCSVCDKHVHFLSAMTRDEAQDLVDDRGKVCIAYVPEPDGSPRFRPARPSRRQLVRAAAALLVGGLALPIPARGSGAVDPEGTSLLEMVRDWFRRDEAPVELIEYPDRGAMVIYEEEPKEEPRRPVIEKEEVDESEVEEEPQEEEPDWSGITMGIMID